jgi:small nuclear ribonucleoprotein (snRNP)-like protein
VKTALLTTDLCVKVSGDETPLKIQEKYTFPCTVGSLTRAYLISSRRNSILSDMSAVELKNDVVLTGTLQSVDQYLNIKLSHVSVVNKEKYPQLVRLHIKLEFTLFAI